MARFEFGKVKSLDDHSFAWQILNSTSKTALQFTFSVNHEKLGWQMFLMHAGDPIMEYSLFCRVNAPTDNELLIRLSQQYELSIVDDKNKEMWSSKTVQDLFFICGYLSANGQFFHVPYRIMSAVNSRLKEGKKCFLQLHLLTKGGRKGEATELDRTTSPQSGLELKDIGSLSEDVEELLLDEDDFDVTVAVQGKEFIAHKNILKARSPVFKRMFAHDMLENLTNRLEIEDCDPDIFAIFRKYLYTGKATLTEKTVVPLYHLADKYDVRSLCKICVFFIRNNYDIEEFGDFAEVACMNKEEGHFFAATVAFLAKNLAITDTVKWMAFLRRNPEGANQIIKELYQHINGNKD